MRAFMSNLDTRWDQDDEISSWEKTHSTVLGFEDGETVLARLAVAEAKHILAEVEPTNEDTTYISACRVSWPDGVSREIAQRSIFASAEAVLDLAEALTQWLQDDDRPE